MTKFNQKLKQLPVTPGVYLHQNAAGEIIYVGKARVLKNRVSQYFQTVTDQKTMALVAEIADFAIIPTETELDALFLESELIKRYQPKYNILLRDDKSQIYIKISDEPRSVISFCRNPVGGGEFFGPYYSAQPIKQALRYLRRIFPFLIKPYAKTRQLDFDINLAPRLDNQAQIKAYQADLGQIKRYIKGERVAIIRDLEAQMKKLAQAQQFEQAAKLRNQIYQLKALTKQIRIEDLSANLQVDQALDDLSQLLGLATKPTRIEGYDISHFAGTNVVASMVVFINGLASKSDYRKFKIKVDQNNDFYNMKEVIKRRLSPKNIKKWGQPDLILIDGGKGQLSSAISVRDQYNLDIPMIGLAKKREQIIISPKSKVKLKTDFIINQQILTFADGDFTVVKLKLDQPIIKLFQRVRNESHRFAITYHDLLKTKHQTDSILDEIKGIGPATKAKLLAKFKTINKIKQASLDQLTVAIGPAKARLIFDFLSDKND